MGFETIHEMPNQVNIWQINEKIYHFHLVSIVSQQYTVYCNIIE